MRGLLAAAVLVAALPVAHAQDKGKTDFSMNGEFRLRNTFVQNAAGNTDSMTTMGVGTHHNVIDQRFKLGMKFKPSERFSVHATLLQSGTFGQPGSEAIANRGEAAANATLPWNEGETSNFMSVNEAYGTWMMMDNLTGKFGRMNYQFGDGAVMAVNDWNIQPYSFDGMNLAYEMEFGKLNFFAFKYRDYNVPPGGTAPLFNGNTGTSDGGHNAYGLVFDMKPMMDMVKAVNLHVIQDNGDAVYGQTGATVQGQQGQKTLRWGLMGAIEMAGFDFKAHYENVGGTYVEKNATGAVTKDSKVKMQMYQAEVGYSLPGLMNSRVSAKYHVDSGRSADDVSNTASGDAKTYDGYFYDRFMAAGAMQIVAWGNLTATSAHWTLNPTDKTMAGVSYWMFQKTEAADSATAGYYGGFAMANQKANDSKDIGQEIDVWAAHNYDGGFTIMAALGHFMPGSWMKNDDATVGNNRKDAITAAVVQGKLTF